MASAQSSQDMWRGRDRQPQTLGNAQPHHRSESRRLSERRRPVKTAARKRDHCPGALHEGDAIRVFSRSAGKWVDGEVVKFVEDDFVRVEYEVGEYWCGKSLHLHSNHLVILPGSDQSSLEATFLSEFLLAPMNLSPPDGYESFSLDVLKHKKSGILVFRHPVRFKAAEINGILLYHYTHERAFFSIKRSREVWATLLKTCQNKFDTCFGDGVYATIKAPDEFGSTDAVLINNYTNTKEAVERRGEFPDVKKYHAGKADYCIPILVPRQIAFNVMQEIAPGLKRPGVMRERHPGEERPVRDDRDIWVISLQTSLAENVQTMVQRFIGLDPDEQRYASEALVEMAMRQSQQEDGSSSPLEALQCCLEDRHPRVRIAAVRSLANLAQKVNCVLFLNHAGTQWMWHASNNWEFYTMGIQPNFEDKRRKMTVKALVSLRQCLEDSDFAVVSAAKEALTHHYTLPVLRRLPELRDVWAALRTHLGELDTIKIIQYHPGYKQFGHEPNDS